LISALKIFLKSLPLNAKFNICSYGTGQFFCFQASQLYSKASLEEATRFVEHFNADRGGTETLAAVKAAMESRDPERTLSIILATDGDITQQQSLFDYINEHVARSVTSVRVFPLGIGNSVSSSLIEGVARAGNGFAQTVIEGEKQDSKIIKMLKGALMPETSAYTMEILYHQDKDDEDYELVERVTDSLRIMMVDEETAPDGQSRNALAESALIISGEDNPDTPMIDTNTEGPESCPKIEPPKLLQAPTRIPPLYPNSRTTVYILLSPSASHKTPKSVILRNNSDDAPFEVAIPVEAIPQPGKTIHSLAAKRAILELEEGRGWLTQARDAQSHLLRDKDPTSFSKMVEAEAIRLGIQHQIAGKWTSFVAVQENTPDSTTGEQHEPPPLPPLVPNSGYRYSSMQSLVLNPDRRYSSHAGAARHNRTSEKARKSVGGQPPRMQLASMAPRKSVAPPYSNTSPGDEDLCGPRKRVLADDDSGPDGTSYRCKIDNSGEATLAAKNRRSKQEMDPILALADPSRAKDIPDEKRRMASHEPELGRERRRLGFRLFGGKKKALAREEEEESDPLQKIIALQTFEGFWDFDDDLLKAIGFGENQEGSEVRVPDGCTDARVWGTVLAVVFLEVKMGGVRGRFGRWLGRRRGSGYVVWVRVLGKGKRAG